MDEKNISPKVKQLVKALYEIAEEIKNEAHEATAASDPKPRPIPTPDPEEDWETKELH